jgi:exopolysaccharide biosynthesis polyprenyl glycosylphosphotransferase
MTPHAARNLRINEYATGEVALLGRPRLAVADAGAIAAPRLHVPDEVRITNARWGAREALHRRLLALADALAATLALLVIVLGLRFPGYDLRVLVSVPVAILLFKIAGLYDGDQMRLVPSTLDEAPLLLQVTGVFVLLVAIVAPLLIDGDLNARRIAVMWMVEFAATLSGRIVSRWLTARSLPVERCLVIGDRDVAERIRAKVASSHARAEIVASVAIPSDDTDSWAAPENLRALAADLRLDRVIVAPPSMDSRGVSELVQNAQAAGLRVSVSPRLLQVVGSAIGFDEIDGMRMIGLRPFGLSRSSRALKRAFDVIATSLGLLVAAPLLAGIALAIRLDSPGPVLFRQVRVGRGGRRFAIFKFRSMVADAERQKERLRQFNEVGEGMFKLAHDPRVTRVGGILRKTSLDELPQLFNVVRGEMSLVGPRPLVEDEDAQVVGVDRSRLHLTPGMTGPWQVLAARVPMQEMVAIDYVYVTNWSLWSDLKLLLRTLRHVLRLGNV